LNQEDISNLNRAITSNKIETVIKILPKNNSSGLDGFIVEFHLIFRERLTPMILKLLHKVQKEGVLSNLFYVVSITLMPKPGKDASQKENHRPISLMSIDAKLLNNMLAHRIQQHIRKIIS
jgi:hypothetical protein